MAGEKGLRGVGLRPNFAYAATALARVILTLALSHKGLTGVGLCAWERGRPARNAALARGDTLILAFSHKGRRDPLTAICI